MESFDVTSLYTNVSNDSALEAVYELLGEHHLGIDMYGLTVGQVMLLLKECLSCNLFRWSGSSDRLPTYSNLSFSPSFIVSASFGVLPRRVNYIIIIIMLWSDSDAVALFPTIMSLSAVAPLVVSLLICWSRSLHADDALTTFAELLVSRFEEQSRAKLLDEPFNELKSKIQVRNEDPRAALVSSKAKLEQLIADRTKALQVGVLPFVVFFAFLPLLGGSGRLWPLLNF
ncbi:unnamed protein product [Heligmosomoides polygyrus]|uniref:Reverse transcriptase domain-containing protein n=1 Tax=Heligmosomoides polygyrus TaxID=6339 RepID=A0A183GJX9_HELPZ|nr:unnamed protein product [Heligmosomoides polygyrus]